jgi:mannose-6-phosphate isomerase-like protein (cupin superfamily)
MSGWSAASIDELGEGYGFRKVRRALEVEHMGVNALVVPSGLKTGLHYHDEQEELYFVHAGHVRFRMGADESETVELGPGGIIRVAPATIRGYENIGDEDLVLLVVGAKDGYVGRDAHLPPGETERVIAPGS